MDQVEEQKLVDAKPGWLSRRKVIGICVAIFALAFFTRDTTPSAVTYFDRRRRTLQPATGVHDEATEAETWKVAASVRSVPRGTAS